jgi:hypothetical protein
VGVTMLSLVVVLGEPERATMLRSTDDADRQ